MSEKWPAIDLKRLRVLPLEQRKSLATLDDIWVDPHSAPTSIADELSRVVDQTATKIRAAKRAGASVMMIYGAHLVKNGAAGIVRKLIEGGWVTHLATNGAGTIHDWEFSWLGRSTESVKENVATGTFGTWDQTGRNIAIALLAAGIAAEGYGRGLGRFIQEDGVTLPHADELEQQVRQEPGHALTPARAELLLAMREQNLQGGRFEMVHRWKHASILAAAFTHGVGMTVHPGIGYDIITCHPMYNGAAVGRAAQRDFELFGGAVNALDGGVVMSVGTAIMGPQVFEKSLSCVNNLRLAAGRRIVTGHSIYVVDLQQGGGWDWTRGEPPKDNPAYYLRFCKSYSRMGAPMQYVQCDNVAFVHHLLHRLSAS